MRCRSSVLVAAALFAITSSPAAGFIDALPQLDLKVAAYDDGESPLANVYTFSVTNNRSSDITGIILDLRPADFGVSQFLLQPMGGGFVGASAAQDYPMTFRGNALVDSFLIEPDDQDRIGLEPSFGPDLISATYVVVGAPVIPANETVDLAILSVPADEQAAVRAGPIYGEVFFESTTVAPITIFPEPASAMLVATVLLGTLGCRRS